MKAFEVYKQSDGAVTKAYYAELEKLGPAGLVAMNLFRAQKCSARAKKYRGGDRNGRYKDQAYERKGWSMGLLCQILIEHAAELGIRWGWGEDSTQDFAPWVLYVDLPKEAQVSFHARSRGVGPAYPGEWDGAVGASEYRIWCFCDRVINSGGQIASDRPQVLRSHTNFQPDQLSFPDSALPPVR